MTLRRLLFFTVAVAATAIAAMFWPNDARPVFGSPGDCVTAFYNGVFQHDDERIKNCLYVDLHGRVAQLKQNKNGIHALMQHPDVLTKRNWAYVEIDEIRKHRTLRYRFHLFRDSNGWSITGIGAPQDVYVGTSTGAMMRRFPSP